MVIEVFTIYNRRLFGERLFADPSVVKMTHLTLKCRLLRLLKQKHFLNTT